MEILKRSTYNIGTPALSLSSLYDDCTHLLTRFTFHILIEFYLARTCVFIVFCLFMYMYKPNRAVANKSVSTIFNMGIVLI